MGKAKKRSLHLGINKTFDNITRQEALFQVLKACKKKSLDDSTKDLITLFGFSCEELLESGANYEDVLSLKPILT